jgi:predicted transcriptional regulator
MEKIFKRKKAQSFMSFLWFGRKKEDEKISSFKSEVKGSFASVRQDMSKIGEWIRHINSKTGGHEDEIASLNDKIDRISEDIDGIKSFISFFDTRLARQNKQLFNKQTAVCGVQTPVQTAVQTAILRGLTSNERVIVWTLLNTDMKLSYEDIAVVLGKDRATVRGQLNNIKQKNNMVSEIIEKNGKKRYYVDEKTKEMLLKTVKVRARGIGKAENLREKV